MTDSGPTRRKENGSSESVLCHVYPADTWRHVPALHLHSSQWNQISKALSVVTQVHCDSEHHRSLDVHLPQPEGQWESVSSDCLLIQHLNPSGPT